MAVMERKPTVHPSQEELRQFVQGRLPVQEAAALEEHLSSCESCCRFLENLPHDSFVGLLREAMGQPAAPTQVHSANFTLDDVPTELADHPRYQVLRLLGRGGMGVVYLAKHKRMGRAVALKVIHPKLLTYPGALCRFEQEARAAAQLDHPNIVAAYDADQAGKLHFLVMEYVEGQNLADHLVAQGPLPISEACEVIRQAARGLEHAHERSMVHRDIKPHNLMRMPDGRVKVLDFGLALLKEDGGWMKEEDADSRGDSASSSQESAARLTGVGAVMGTADYIAPEQVQDSRRADGRADIYSLGCVLYHLLAGTPPFPEGTVAQKLQRNGLLSPRALRGLRSDTPEELAGIVARMMAKKPQDRYQTAGEVAAALAPFARGALPKRSTPRRISFIGMGLVLILLLVTAAAGVLRLPAGRDREIIIQTDDPTVEVIVKGDRIVRIVDPKTGRAYRLDREELTLSLVDEPDGLAVMLDGQNPIVLKRQGKRIATVWLEPAARPTPPAQSSGGFFNGKNLTGWKGLPGYWRVRDGAILGACPEGRSAHTFLVSDKTYKDFDLKFQVRRQEGIGNSGVQFRSRIADHGKLTVVGPQCEIDSANFSFPPGSLLTEPDLKPLAEKVPRRAAIAAKYRDADFNDFHIRCIGNHVTIKVNGVTAIDDDYPDLPDEGVIAWQIHGYMTPRELTFRNIEFMDLSAGFKPLPVSKGLPDWILEGDDSRFRTEGGVLVATSPHWKSRGYLLREGQYANYRLRFECRLEEGANCGVVVRGRLGERSNFAQPNAIDHPVIKLTDSSGNPNLPPGGSHWVASGNHDGPRPRDIRFPIGEWNAVEVEVKGTSCRVWLNAVLAVSLKLDEANRSGHFLAGLAREKGHIGFQANVGTARFRHIAVQELPPTE